MCFARQLRSAQQRRQRDSLESVVRQATAGHLASQSSALPSLDQHSRQFRRGEVGVDVTGTPLPHPHTIGKSLGPAVENAGQFHPDRFTGPAELQRHVADKAAEQEVRGLMLVGKRMENLAMRSRANPSPPSTGSIRASISDQ